MLFLAQIPSELKRVWFDTNEHLFLLCSSERCRHFRGTFCPRVGGKQYPKIKLLQGTQGVGSLVSLADVLTLSDSHRFPTVVRWASYIGQSNWKSG